MSMEHSFLWKILVKFWGQCVSSLVIAGQLSKYYLHCNHLPLGQVTARELFWAVLDIKCAS